MDDNLREEVHSARERGRYDIDNTAWSETRFSDARHLTEHRQGYSFLCKGKHVSESRIDGVGSAIGNSFISKLSEFPVGISERLMTLHLPRRNSRYAFLISAYASTLNSDDGVNDAFHASLRTVFVKVPTDDKIILLCDFNARVWKESALYSSVIGKEGVGKANDNGFLVLSKCAEHRLINNKLFRQKNAYKTSAPSVQNIGTSLIT